MTARRCAQASRPLTGSPGGVSVQVLGQWVEGTLGPPQLVLMPVDKGPPPTLGPQLGPGCT